MTETLPIPVATVNLQPTPTDEPYYTPEERANILQIWEQDQLAHQVELNANKDWENSINHEKSNSIEIINLLQIYKDRNGRGMQDLVTNKRLLAHLIRHEVSKLMQSDRIITPAQITDKDIRSTGLNGLMMKFYPTWQEAVAGSFKGLVKPYSFVDAEVPSSYWKKDKGRVKLIKALKETIEVDLSVDKYDPEEFRKAILSISVKQLPYFRHSLNGLGISRPEQLLIEAYPELRLRIEDFSPSDYWYTKRTPLFSFDDKSDGLDTSFYQYYEDQALKARDRHLALMSPGSDQGIGTGHPQTLSNDKQVRSQEQDGEPEPRYYSERERAEIFEVWDKLKRRRENVAKRSDQYVHEEAKYLEKNRKVLEGLIERIRQGEDVSSLVKNKTEAIILAFSRFTDFKEANGGELKIDQMDENFLKETGVLNIIKKFYPYYQVGLSRASHGFISPYSFKEPMPDEYWAGQEGRARLTESVRLILEDQVCVDKTDPETFRKIILSISAETIPFLGSTIKRLFPDSPEDILMEAYPELKLRHEDFSPSGYWSEHLNVRIVVESEIERLMLISEPNMEMLEIGGRKKRIEEMKAAQMALIQIRSERESTQLGSSMIFTEPKVIETSDILSSEISEKEQFADEEPYYTDPAKKRTVLELWTKQFEEQDAEDARRMKELDHQKIYVDKHRRKFETLLTAIKLGQDISGQVQNVHDAKILIKLALNNSEVLLGYRPRERQIGREEVKRLGVLTLVDKFYPYYQVGLEASMNYHVPISAFKEPLPIEYWQGKKGRERLIKEVRDQIENQIVLEKLDPEVFRKSIRSLSAADLPGVGYAIKEISPDYPMDILIEAYPELELKREDFSPGTYWSRHLYTAKGSELTPQTFENQTYRDGLVLGLVEVHQRLAEERLQTKHEVEHLDSTLIDSEPKALEATQIHLNPELELIIQEAIDGKGDDFEQDYAESNDTQTKFKLAEALIRDGRFPRPDLLIDNLGPDKNAVITELKNQLIAIKIESRLEKSPDLKALIDSGVPIEVVTQIAVVEFFSEITDEQKLEELRSRITQPVLREYLGILRGQKQVRDLTAEEKMDMIPDEVFSNPHIVKFGLLERYFEGQLMRMLTDKGINGGMAEFDKIIQEAAPGKKEFLTTIRDRFLEIATAPAPPGFRSKIQVNGELKPFPSFEQNAFLYDFINNNCRFLTAETGLGKSATSFMAMESTDARKVMIIAPAIARETWRIEEEKIFQNPGQVFIVEKAEHLFDPQISEKKYIVISQNLLGTLDGKPEVSARIQEIINEHHVEGAIIDEIDSLSNPRAISVKFTFQFLDLIRQNYSQTHEGKDAPILGLSATPIRKSISDLDIPMAMLYPDLYARSFAQSSPSKRTFSQKTLRNPEVVFATLIGERRMFRWENANGVQEFNYASIPIDLSPFERELYEYVLERVPAESLDKIRILEDLLLNPHLVKAEVRRKQNGILEEIDLDETVEVLKDIALRWKEHHGVDAPVTPDQFLDIDRLVEMGYSELALKSFFSQALDGGLDYLVEQYTRNTEDPVLQNLGRFWKPREISTKYEELRQMILDGLSPRIEDGQVVREKIFIVSPSRKQGRTKGVQQRTVTSENGREKLYSEPELAYINDTTLIKRINGWLGTEYGKDAVMLLDGSVRSEARNAIIQRWKSDPNAQVLLVTLESTYQSRDFTIQETLNEYGVRTKGVTKIFLGWPWYHQQFKQMVGRSQRQGQVVPVRNVVLEASGTIDQGKRDQVMYTALLTRLALGGARLTPEEQEFFDERKSSDRLIDAGLDATYMRDSLVSVRAKGEDIALEFYEAKTSRDKEKTNEVKFAEKYFDEGNDQYRVAGQNSQLVAAIASESLPINARVLSLGAGTLLFQRNLRRPVVNVDINSAMMDVAKHLVEEYGGTSVVGRASRLNEEDFGSNSFDFVDSSFALHWSSLGTDIQSSERVKILSQINRVLSLGGRAVITVPDSAFDQETFEKFAIALERNFGFEVDQKFSGKTFAISSTGTRKRLGWGLTLVKKSEVSISGLSLDDLSFLYDSLYWTSLPDKGKRKPVKKKEKVEIEEVQIDPDRFEIINLENEVETIEPEGRAMKGAIELPQVDSDIQTSAKINDDSLIDILDTESSQSPEVDDTTTAFTISPQVPETKSSTDTDAASPKAKIEDYEAFLKLDYSAFRRLIRQIQAETDLGWDQSIEMAIGVLQSLDASGKLRAQGNPYSRVISEIKRKKKI